MKETSKYKTYTETGLAKCSIHGEHNEWSKQNGHQIRKGREYKWNGLECLKCSRERQKAWREEHPNYQDRYRFTWRGTISRALAYAQRRAKDKKLPFEINSEWMINMLNKQNSRCFYSGIEFEWEKSINGKPRYKLVSIDQRVAGKGYTKDNSVLVCWGINLMKHEIPLDQFIEFCKSVSSTQKENIMIKLAMEVGA